MDLAVDAGFEGVGDFFGEGRADAGEEFLEEGASGGGRRISWEGTCPSSEARAMARSMSPTSSMRPYSAAFKPVKTSPVAYFLTLSGVMRRDLATRSTKMSKNWVMSSSRLSSSFLVGSR